MQQHPHNLRISIVLATYNGEAFLEELLDSLLAQTLPAIEIIISDDNSTDGTTQILDLFAARSFVPVVRMKNTPGLGFRDNFIHASQKAKGNWIAFCDQDDIWRADKLENCAKYFDVPGLTQIVHKAVLIERDGKYFGNFNQGIVDTEIRPPLHYDVWGTFFGFSMVIRKDLFDIVSHEKRFIDYIDPRYLIAHDRWAFFLAQTLGKTAEIAEPLVSYRQHENNLYGFQTRRTIEARITIREKNRPYVLAAAAMLEIVQGLPPDAKSRFTAFDRQAALSTYRRAFAQVSSRATVYDSGRLKGIVLVASNFFSGVYRSSENGTERWRSLIKDIVYCFLP